MKNAYVTSNLNDDLPDSLSLKFETFRVKSLLIISYSSAEISNGFFSI